MNKTNIILAGEGGQGVQTIAEVFAKSCFNDDKNISYMPSFGVEQRGTPSVAFITVGSQKFFQSDISEVDYIFILQKRAIEKVSKYITEKTVVVFDSSVISRTDLPEKILKLYGIPATKIAVEKFRPRSYNLIMLGVLAKLFDSDQNEIWSHVESKLSKKFKTQSELLVNRNAFLAGYDFRLESEKYSSADYKTKNKTILIKGHGKTGEICPSRCKGCGICVFKCPVGALQLNGDFGVFATPIPRVDLEKCIACGNCRNFCPDSAISITKD